MQALFSPGSLITVAGAVLTVIGSVAYLTDSPNLSLPAIFYGIPVLLGGLALKSAELPPARRLTDPTLLRPLRDLPENQSLRKLLEDVSRWRYGQKAHLESSRTTATDSACCSAARVCHSSAGRTGRIGWDVSSDLA